MSRTISRADATNRHVITAITALGTWAFVVALGLLVAVQLAFFAIRAAHLLSYPYPLDYGEGPLLAQANLLRAGTPIWRLYADPSAPPYAVVNYPPVYHLLAALLAMPLGDTLLAGRLVSLAATLGSAAALWRLAAPLRPSLTRSPFIARGLVALAFLGLPIVREWAAVMRVDMLGVCLGLWGLALVRRGVGRRAIMWAALPLAFSLLTKPSLVAAPAAALVWLLFRDWRSALRLGLALALGGGLFAALVQAASGGWFAIHVFAANANPWQRDLAYTFWRDQLLILWPLLAAGVAGFLRQSDTTADRRPPTQREGGADALLPLYYTLFGAIVAFGVGKVGAYANYFLEFYAGLIWLAAAGIAPRAKGDGMRFAVRTLLPGLLAPLIMLGAMGALLRYYPIWSATYLKLAGIIEGSNPPRLTLGRYGVWQDLQRERDILATLDDVNAALNDEVQAAAGPIFTDIPGIAAQAKQLARLQAFEHRQLLDAGLWDQRPLLRDMANGRVPLVALDYLGNWLMPEMIALISNRYAQSGSRGTYDLYRPVDPGPRTNVDLAFPNGLQLAGYHLAPSPGRPAYHGGETALLTLEWRRDATHTDEARYEVVAQLADEQGRILVESTRPLLYGALPPPDWGDQTVQHMQPIELPPDLPAQTYRLMVGLRAEGRDLTPPQMIGAFEVESMIGQVLGERRPYYVPAPLFAYWERAGGYAGPGDPLMPATPFDGHVDQCFVWACLRWRAGGIERLPLGELVRLADVSAHALRQAARAPSLSGPFLDYWRKHGGAEVFGPPITPEFIRGEQIVQYTRYARLERPVAGGSVQLGRLGDEFLRLPPGVVYRWP